jgi:hypothetical protein
MRHRTPRIVIGVAALACFVGGTAIGVGLQHRADRDPRTAFDAPLAAPGTGRATDAPGTQGGPGPDGIPGTADDPVAADAGGAGGEPGVAGAGDREDGNANNGNGNGGRPLHPPVPDFAFDPDAFAPPQFHIPDNADNGNGGGAQPPAEPQPTPLSIFQTGRLGPGPIWEWGGSGICGGSDHSGQIRTWITVAVHQVPRSTPYSVTATARAAATVVPATVQQEPGQPHRFTVSYSFPPGSVRLPANIAINATVTDAQGRRATMPEFGGRAGIGHRLFPANYCP